MPTDVSTWHRAVLRNTDFSTVLQMIGLKDVNSPTSSAPQKSSWSRHMRTFQASLFLSGDHSRTRDATF